MRATRWRSFDHVRSDVGGVEVQRAVHRRRPALVVHVFRHPDRPLPRRTRGRVDDVELGPGERADVALAQRVPVFLIDHVAHGLGIVPRSLAIHGDLRHRILAGRGFAAGLVVDVACQAVEAAGVELAHAGDLRVALRGHGAEGKRQRADDHAAKEREDQHGLVGPIPKQAQLVEHRRNFAGPARAGEGQNTFLSLFTLRRRTPAPSARASWSRTAAAFSNSRLRACSSICFSSRLISLRELLLAHRLVARPRPAPPCSSLPRLVGVVDAVDHVLDALLRRRIGVMPCAALYATCLRAPAVGLADRRAASNRSRGRRTGSPCRSCGAPRGRWSGSASARSAGSLPCRRRGSPPATPRECPGLRAAG